MVIPAKIWFILAALAALLTYHFYEVHDAFNKGHDKAILENAQTVADAKGRYDTWLDQDKLSFKRLGEENAFLRSLDSSIPIRVVRLSISAASGSSAVPEGGKDSGVAGGRPFHPDLGPDIGPRLYALMREADVVVAKCRRLNDSTP